MGQQSTARRRDTRQHLHQQPNPPTASLFLLTVRRGMTGVTSLHPSARQQFKGQNHVPLRQTLCPHTEGD